jgi:ribonuclease P/MRP protein subunit RPP40
LKFADDAKLYRQVSDQICVDALREDLRNLYQWSEDWQMLFNIDKCKVMHFGYKNPRQQYCIGDNILSVVEEEKDLGVIIQNDLKVSQQCSKVVKTANQILGMIRRSFQNRSKYIMLLLYKSLVRPHLEYCVQVWRPHLAKDINLIENVQRRATRMIPELCGMTYEERLMVLNLTTLETRRLRGDLIEIFKILKGFDKTSITLCTNQLTFLRGHTLKLFKNRFNTNIGKFNFVNRSVDEWNKLSEDIVSCNSVDSFKNKLDRYIGVCWGLI